MKRFQGRIPLVNTFGKASLHPVDGTPRSVRIQEFPLTIGDTIKDFACIPPGATNMLYHYTTRAGLEGIVRDGGLRATFRGRMEDRQEFTYPQQVIDEVFKEIGRRPGIPSLTTQLIGDCSVNLRHNRADCHATVRAYCSCILFVSHCWSGPGSSMERLCRARTGIRVGL